MAASGCSNGDSSSSGRAIDNAFASEMIPHHEGAIEIAELAEARGLRPEIRRFARRMITSQRGKIAALQSARRELENEEVPLGDLGLSAEHTLEAGDIRRLRGAADFDRAFIEMMIPHHGGAIDMAVVELRNGQDNRLKRLARSIIDIQQREIRQMETFFADWYGEEVDHETPAHHGG